MNKPENPPAFPGAISTGFTPSSAGMTLRDWFASQALAGLVTSNAADCVSGNQSADRYAEDAYCIADAMLAARQESSR